MHPGNLDERLGKLRFLQDLIASFLRAHGVAAMSPQERLHHKGSNTRKNESLRISLPPQRACDAGNYPIPLALNCSRNFQISWF